MPTVMVTFVHSTYALATIVHISIISGVTDLILTKLFGPKIFLVLVFVDQNFLAQKLKAVLSITLKFSNHPPTAKVVKSKVALLK